MSLLGRKRGRAILASAVEPLDDRVAAASPHCAAQPLDEDGSERSLDAAFAAFDASCRPSDTLVALRVSRRRFPLLAAARARRRRADAALTPAAADELRLTEPVAGCAAVPLSLLYEAAPDRLAVDRELAALQLQRITLRLVVFFCPLRLWRRRGCHCAAVNGRARPCARRAHARLRLRRQRETRGARALGGAWRRRPSLEDAPRLPDLHLLLCDRPEVDGKAIGNGQPTSA